MQQLPGVIPPLYDEPFVALDLETTGFSPERDEIIEVGAVKFQGERVLDTYSTLVNPYRSLPEAVHRLTGITQKELQQAPPFAAIAAEVEAFIGRAPLVGHNVAFDAGFLAQKGVGLESTTYDTWDLAFVLLPQRRVYSLGPLAASLGIVHPRPHRALEDAQVTQRLFVALLELARGMDPGILAELRRLASQGQWPMGHLLAQVEALGAQHPAGRRSGVSPGGVDLEVLRQRLARPRALRQGTVSTPVDEETLDALMEPGGPLAEALPSYERREEQERMAKRVAAALNEGHHLMVEGGTGLGKSLAYLIPAALFALKNDVRVVISTNTINLQEQLISKDIPAVIQTLDLAGLAQEGDLRVAHLKGKGNYLCLRRWAHLRAAEALNREEARFLSKVLVWLQTTSSGDREEMGLPAREEYLWDRMSGRGAQECINAERVCFVRSARERAEATHLLVVNHALLLADAATGGALLPEHRYLIVDEAHHLEEEATHQFGFQASQEAQMETLSALVGQRGLLQQVRFFVGRRGVPPLRRERLAEEIADLEKDIARASGHIGGLYDTLSRLASHLAERGDDANRQLWVTPSTRAQPDWSRMEVLWEEAHLALGTVIRELEGLQEVVREFAEVEPSLAEALHTELAAQEQDLREARNHLREILAEPQQDMVYWLSETRRESHMLLQGAPLEVGQLLQERLYDGKESVILTGATLTAGGTFDHLRQRVGLAEAEEHLEGSPFDYLRRALLLVPEDMPTPDSPSYRSALAEAVIGLAGAAQGRTLVLFTSHASLRATYADILGPLAAEGIHALAQGIDGPPQRILGTFLEEPHSVLLGTSSFWEGVDIPGGVLKVLVMARLPFGVPTEPIFAARSQLFDNPFTEYAVPQAIPRFRQGFGRLIRRRQDKGVVVVLDQRLIGRSYGASFLKSIPQCTFKIPTISGLAPEVKNWIGE